MSNFLTWGLISIVAAVAIGAGSSIVKADNSALTLDDMKYYQLFLETYQEQQCLATAVFMEARGEPRRGQQAVAHVVLNRTLDSRWHDQVCHVVYAKKGRSCDFSWSCKFSDKYVDSLKSAYPEAWIESEEVAWQALTDTGPKFSGITHFFNPDHSVPSWASSDVMTKVTEIGNHKFYREN